VDRRWSSNRPWDQERLAVEVARDLRVLGEAAVPEPSMATVRDFASAALAGGVRNYDQAVEAVCGWLEPERLARLSSAARGRPWTWRSGDRLTLQVVKEGATSSVVLVRVRRPGGRESRFVVNVARDATTASIEQRSITQELVRMRGWDAVTVLEESCATLRWFGRDLRLSMLAVSFAPGLEIHPLPDASREASLDRPLDGSPAASPRLVLVDGFADTPGDAVPGFRGRLLSERDADAVWAAVVTTSTRSAAVVGGKVHLPTVELADGDVIAEPGGPVTVVATDGHPWRIPLAWWPFAVGLVSARDDRTGGRQYWDKPRAALAAFQDGLAPERRHVISDAAALTDEALQGILRSHEQRYGGAPPLDQLRAVRALLSTS
jgi:hypothetical protein